MHTLKQIRMIATDMDGTLLNSRNELPRDFFHILEELHRRHILFVIASGRPYPTLAMQFSQYRDKMIIMAENGGCLVSNDQLIHLDALDEEQLRYLVGLCQPLPDAFPILSGFRRAYIFDATPPQARSEIGRYYKEVRYIQDYADIDSPVSKVAVCDFRGAEKNTFPILSQVPAPFKATLAGPMWTDLGLASVHKGKGLAALQEIYHIAPEETMVFGDYLNDCEMMQKGYFSYATANAHPQLKAVSRFETLSNDEDGVLHVIRQLLTALDAS